MEPPRRGLTDRFARIVEAVRGLVASEALLDGEAVACGGGSDFSARLTKRGGAQASHASKATGLWPTRRAHMRPWRRSGLGRASVTLTPPTRVYVVLYLNQSSQLSVSRWARARIRPPDEADKCDFSLLFAGCAACLFRLQAQKIGDDPINLRRGQQECGHSAVPARFSVWLSQKFAQRRLGDFGPRSDLDEARGRRVEDRRAALICGNDMASGADLEREPTAGGDSPRLLPARGNDPRKSERKGLRGQQRFSHRVLDGIRAGADREPQPALLSFGHSRKSFRKRERRAAGKCEGRKSLHKTNPDAVESGVCRDGKARLSERARQALQPQEHRDHAGGVRALPSATILAQVDEIIRPDIEALGLQGI